MDTKEHFTVEDCEQAGQRLVHIMLALYDKRVQSAPKAHSPVGNAMGEAAMSVKAGISAFLMIERLHDPAKLHQELNQEVTHGIKKKTNGTK
jgi:hypothetical protein